MYSTRLLDHFQNPRNVGELPPPAVTVEVSNPVCGDILRLSVEFRDGRVAEARYKTRGCTASSAASHRKPAVGRSPWTAAYALVGPSRLSKVDAQTTGTRACGPSGCPPARLSRRSGSWCVRSAPTAGPRPTATGCSAAPPSTADRA